MNAHPAVLGLRNLHVPEYNPRRYIPQDQKWEEFKASILAFNGVFTPILVRPVQGKKTPYEIIAGQRRFFGALEMMGQDYEIPVLCKDMTDEEAKAAALAENIDREPMSPAEEAEAAARLLAQYNGDHNETAKRMGWSPATLTARLKLMACSNKVRDGLTKRKIPLGIAEMLSGMTYEQQDSMVDEYAESGFPTLEETRALVMAKTKSLEQTIFDQAECGTCPHNSAKQQSMFANIDGGHCMNSVCFDGKVEAKLQEIADGLKEEYNRIEIFRPGDNFKLAKIDVQKLGETQVAACRNCKDCGAAVSAMPNKLGMVSKNLCFGTVCFEERVTAFADEKKAAAQAASDAEKAVVEATAASNAESNGSEPVETGTAQSVVGEQPTEKAPPTEKSVQPVALTNALHEFRDTFYRRVIAVEYAVNPAFASSFVFALVLSNRGGYFDGTAMQESLLKAGLIQSTSKLHALKDAMKTTLAIGKEVVDKKLPLLGALAMTKLTRDELKDMMILSEADLAKHFKLNSEAGIAFLKVLTKDQITSICDELGIKKAMGQTFNSIANGKKDDFIKHVTSVADFPYEGKVPKALKPAFGK